MNFRRGAVPRRGADTRTVVVWVSTGAELITVLLWCARPGPGMCRSTPVTRSTGSSTVADAGTGAGDLGRVVVDSWSAALDGPVCAGE